MNPNEREKSARSVSEDNDRVYKTALSLVPAAEALARRFELSSGTGYEIMMKAADHIVNSRVAGDDKVLERISNLPAYLFGAGRRLMLQEVKRKKKEVNVDEIDLATHDDALTESRILVSEIVQRMNPKTKAIFRYRTQGYGYGEIAEEFRRMGVKATEASLRSEFSKSVKRIIKELQAL